MPSHTPKQARVMSAIAHGWRPSGLDIPVKVAKEFHQADAGKKWGAKHAVGGALRAARRVRRDIGGSVGATGYDEDYDPITRRNLVEHVPQEGDFLPRWGRDAMPAYMAPPLPDADTLREKLMHRGMELRGFADGGDTDVSLPDVGEPLIDPGRQISAGTRIGNKAADIASRVAYNAMKNSATMLPRYVRANVDAGRTVPGSEEAHRAYEDVGDITGELGMSRLSPGRVSPTPTAYSFIGPYGAHMLREQQRAAGRPAPVHPVMGQEMEARTRDIHPALRDTVRSALVDSADARARAQLEMRQAAAFPERGPPTSMEEAIQNFQRSGEGGFHHPGDRQLTPIPGARYAQDRDIFPQSGWSIEPKSGIPIKEISDLGAKMVPTGNTSMHPHWLAGESQMAELPELRLEHPAGDLHQAYGIPHIILDKGGHRLPPDARAGFDPNNGRLYVRSPKDVSAALHETQHAIANKEGFPAGTNSHVAMKRPEFQQELFIYPDSDSSGGAYIPSWHGQMDRDFRSAGQDPNSGPNIVDKAARATYGREAGENMAVNVQDRRAKGYRYLVHPEDTESFSRGLQYSDVKPPRPRSAIKIHEPSTPEEHIDAIAEGDHYIPYNRRPRFAAGGAQSNFNPERAMAFGLARQQGMLHSPVPGRTDKLNLDVSNGSYIIPADITSALGQGNSLAGDAVLSKMFNKGPYGMNITKMKSGSPRGGMRQSSLSRMSFSKKTKGLGFDDGGGLAQSSMTPSDTSQIVAAGGEFVVDPRTIIELGGGNIDAGHDILDRFVKNVREKNIQTLKGLKPPKGSSEAHRKGKA